MMEDFALRFTAKRARIWSYGRIANTALGIVSFLVLEAIGGAITLNFGFANSAWAILSVFFYRLFLSCFLLDCPSAITLQNMALILIY